MPIIPYFNYPLFKYESPIMPPILQLTQLFLFLFPLTYLFACVSLFYFSLPLSVSVLCVWQRAAYVMQHSCWHIWKRIGSPGQKIWCLWIISYRSVFPLVLGHCRWLICDLCYQRALWRLKIEHAVVGSWWREIQTEQHPLTPTHSLQSHTQTFACSFFLMFYCHNGRYLTIFSKEITCGENDIPKTLRLSPLSILKKMTHRLNVI